MYSFGVVLFAFCFSLYDINLDYFCGRNNKYKKINTEQNLRQILTITNFVVLSINTCMVSVVNNVTQQYQLNAVSDIFKFS